MKTAVKTKRRNAISKGTTKICAHIIEWCLYEKGLALTAIDLEQIVNSLINNEVEGELCTITANGFAVSGWWNIQW